MAGYAGQRAALGTQGPDWDPTREAMESLAQGLERALGCEGGDVQAQANDQQKGQEPRRSRRPPREPLGS